MKSYVAVTCLLALTAAIKADGGLGLGGLVYAPGHASADYYSYPSYAFEYAVKDPHTGDNKAQWEKRDGDVVKGAYSLVEPDGNVRVVEYWADDKSGFNAVVKRLGPNVHPSPVAVAPIYKAPIPIIGSEHIAPISVGPIARYEGLADAPLISGPIHGGAISSASLYKYNPIIKAAHAPILAEPILPAPIIKSAPILSVPLHKSGPIISAPLPVLPSPIIKTAPAYSGYSDLPAYGYYDGAHAKGPAVSQAYYDGGLAKEIAINGYYDGDLAKGVELNGYYGGGLAKGLANGYYGGGLLKGVASNDYYEGGYAKVPYASQYDLGAGLHEKGPLLSSWDGSSSYPYLGLKH